MDSKTLLNDIAVNIGRDKQDIATLLKAFVGVLREHSSVGDSIAVPGFGTFEVVKTDEQISTDPDTGKRLLLPPHISLNFRPSALLRSKCHAVIQIEDSSSSVIRNKVAFPELVEAVAKATNTTKEVSETFLRQLFATISDALRNGQNVVAAELGSFKIIQNEEGTKSILFEPDKQLAAQINAPFASFVAVEIGDDVSLDRIESVTEEIDEIPETTDDENPEPCENIENVPGEPDELAQAEESLEPEDISETNSVQATTETEQSTEKMEIYPVDEGSSTPNEETGENTTSDTAENSAERYVVPEVHEEEEFLPKPEKSGNQFVRGFLWGAITMFFLYVIVGVAIYFYVTRDNAEQAYDTVELPSETQQNEDKTSFEGGPEIVDHEPLSDENSAAAMTLSGANTVAATTPEEGKAEQARPTPTKNVVVLDTVTHKMYLSRISKKHYGHSDFWGYIYEENKAKLGNPNKIPPGTVVVIPPAEKYGIDPNNPESLTRARAKITAILKKYN